MIILSHIRLAKWLKDHNTAYDRNRAWEAFQPIMELGIMSEEQEAYVKETFEQAEEMKTEREDYK